MPHGSAEFRPRSETATWALATTVGFVVLWIGTRDLTYLFPGSMCFAVWLQCKQRIEIDGRVVRRIGLRPTEVDLQTVEVVATGTGWWRELFFCGRTLQLRDADGHRLYLEAWLWPPDLSARLLASNS